jgi:hypothetical protein
MSLRQQEKLQQMDPTELKRKLLQIITENPTLLADPVKFINQILELDKSTENESCEETMKRMLDLLKQNPEKEWDIDELVLALEFNIQSTKAVEVRDIFFHLLSIKVLAWTTPQRMIKLLNPDYQPK